MFRWQSLRCLVFKFDNGDQESVKKESQRVDLRETLAYGLFNVISAYAVYDEAIFERRFYHGDRFDISVAIHHRWSRRCRGGEIPDQAGSVRRFPG